MLALLLADRIALLLLAAGLTADEIHATHGQHLLAAIRHERRARA